MKQIYRIFSLLVLLTVGLSLSAQKQIVIFSTNDMHSHINEFAKISAYIENFRKENPKTNVLILSAGDIYSGNPIVDQYQEKGLPIIDLMNRVGYQYTALGNHDFDYGQEIAQKRREEAKFPFICANIKMDPAVCKVKPMDPYVIFKTDGIKVGIVSVVEASVHADGVRYPACHPARVKGMTFTDPMEEILNYKYLRKKCDLFIGLTHTGYDQDLLIADKMPELDVIVGGHTHTKIDTVLLRNNVLVTQTGCYTQGLGKITLTFKGHKLVSRDYELIDISKLKAENAEIAQKAQEFIDSSPMKTVLAEAAEQLDGKEELGGLMCDALISEYGADFAVQNSGGVRIGQMKKGPITMQDVYSLDPFGNSVVLYNMTYQQLCEFLMNSHHKASKRADLLCSGLKYTIFTKDGVATRVEITDEAGNPVDQNRTFKVAMNSYISAIGKFDRSGLIEETANSASDALIAYLKKVKTVKKDIHRTQVVEE